MKYMKKSTFVSSKMESYGEKDITKVSCLPQILPSLSLSVSFSVSVSKYMYLEEQVFGNEKGSGNRNENKRRD